MRILKGMLATIFSLCVIYLLMAFASYSFNILPVFENWSFGDRFIFAFFVGLISGWAGWSGWLFLD